MSIGVRNYVDRHACRAAIEQCVTSGDVEAFDLVAYHMVDNAANAVAGHYLNWHEIPYVDFGERLRVAAPFCDLQTWKL